MSVTFQKATKQQARLRMALVGPSGSGKTFTALAVGTNLGSRVALVDTEHGSASKYADLFDFDVLELDAYSPLTYVEAIAAAGAAGYDVLVIDSLSHAWTGKEGALEQVDMATARSRSKNAFAEGWREVTPMHNQLIDAIIAAPMHVVATMRVKTEYVIEENERGQKVPRKVGLAPVQRAGMEYEFDIVGDIDHDHRLVVTKSRCAALTDAVLAKPGKDMADTLTAWLGSGEPLASADAVARLAEVAALLDEADPQKFPWQQLAEQVAKRDFNRALAQLTASQHRTVVDQLETRLADKQADQAEGNPGDGTSMDVAPDAAVADADQAHEPASFPPNVTPAEGEEQSSVFEEMAAKAQQAGRNKATA